MTVMADDNIDTEKWCSIAEEYRAMADNVRTPEARTAWNELANHAERQAVFAALRHVYVSSRRQPIVNSPGGQRKGEPVC